MICRAPVVVIEQTPPQTIPVQLRLQTISLQTIPRRTIPRRTIPPLKRRFSTFSASGLQSVPEPLELSEQCLVAGGLVTVGEPMERPSESLALKPYAAEARLELTSTTDRGDAATTAAP
jgi:hypothetical protein